MTAFKVGDTGHTRDHKPYRIIAIDLVGGVGPIAAAVTRNEEEQLTRFRANGTHPSDLHYQDILPPTGRVS